MRYGAVVVARSQGCVIHDVRRVRDIENVAADENGFTFAKYDSDDFFDAVMDALDVQETPAFAELRKRAAETSLSMCETAKAFVDLYQSL
jgi:glycogen synthase